MPRGGLHISQRQLCSFLAHASLDETSTDALQLGTAKLEDASLLIVASRGVTTTAAVCRNRRRGICIVAIAILQRGTLAARLLVGHRSRHAALSFSGLLGSGFVCAW